MTDSSDGGSSKPRGRPFRPGNPGKPKGARHRTTRAVEALLEGEAEALTRAAIDAALDGDVGALRLCLERIAPVRKGRTLNLHLPPVNSAADAQQALGAVIGAVAAGDLTPEEATSVAALIEGWRRTHETQDFAARLAALEAEVKSCR